MGFESNSDIFKSARRDYEIVVSGMAWIDIRQSMRFSRKQLRQGSIAGDWLAVGKDLAKALTKLKSEKEAA